MTHEEKWVPNGREMAACARQTGETPLEQHPGEKPGREEPEHQPGWGFDANGSLIADRDGHSDDRPANPPEEDVIAPRPHFTPERIRIGRRHLGATAAGRDQRALSFTSSYGAAHG
jgi:hypothetical protein